LSSWLVCCVRMQNSLSLLIASAGLEAKKRSLLETNERERKERKKERRYFEPFLRVLAFFDVFVLVGFDF
jgi:hypothetical protein